jgi:hypothetical protein
MINTKRKKSFPKLWMVKYWLNDSTTMLLKQCFYAITLPLSQLTGKEEQLWGNLNLAWQLLQKLQIINGQRFIGYRIWLLLVALTECGQDGLQGIHDMITHGHEVCVYDMNCMQIICVQYNNSRSLIGVQTSLYRFTTVLQYNRSHTLYWLIKCTNTTAIMYVIISLGF